MIFAQTAVNTSSDFITGLPIFFEPLKEQIISLFDSVLPILIQIGCASIAFFLGLFLFVQIKKYFAAGADVDIIDDLYDDDDGYLHYDGLIFEDEGDLNDYLHGKLHPEVYDGMDEYYANLEREKDERYFEKVQERMNDKISEKFA